ncbi:MAG: DNA alkylation repair protein [Flavobacteriales bacterium]|nr:DNA alkylation repair protein [Flavobacteriales bacterium]
MESQDYLKKLESAFRSAANEENAAGMEAYMKDQFSFLGIKSPERKAIQQDYFRASERPQIQDLRLVILYLWELDEREFQYCAQELFHKYSKQLDPSHIELIEDIVLSKPWWDTIDFIASNIIGTLFQRHPEIIQSVTEQWMNSEDMWLQRCCLLFQLKYKNDFDVALLESFILRLNDHPEFFIRKAIGWSLRQLSKFAPESVNRIISEIPLSPLSVREGSKYL